MWLASYESPNFTFDALAPDPEDAKAALIRGLAAHAQQHRLRADWFTLDDVQLRNMAEGVCYRDREPMPQA